MTEHHQHLERYKVTKSYFTVPECKWSQSFCFIEKRFFVEKQSPFNERR